MTQNSRHNISAARKVNKPDWLIGFCFGMDFAKKRGNVNFYGKQIKLKFLVKVIGAPRLSRAADKKPAMARSRHKHYIG